jgi:ketosteroid isomerase-like protein
MNGVELAHKFFDATQAGDRATLDRMSTEDAVVWHNYDGVDMPFRVIAQGLGAVSRLLKDFAYCDRKYLSVPEGTIAQHSFKGIMPDGTRLDVPMMVRLFLRGDKIYRFEEYLDPAAMAPLVKALVTGISLFEK